MQACPCQTVLMLGQGRHVGKFGAKFHNPASPTHRQNLVWPCNSRALAKTDQTGQAAARERMPVVQSVPRHNLWGLRLPWKPSSNVTAAGPHSAREHMPWQKPHAKNETAPLKKTPAVLGEAYRFRGSGVEEERVLECISYPP
jgi:hypothetical protein